MYVQCMLLINLFLKKKKERKKEKKSRSRIADLYDKYMINF